MSNTYWFFAGLFVGWTPAFLVIVILVMRELERDRSRGRNHG